jgi:uncharacterized protein (TIGR00299 family) protein
MSPIIIDPRLSGASGDMLIAALLDMHSGKLNSDFCQLFQTSIRRIDPHFELKLQRINNGGIIGSQLETKFSKAFSVSEIGLQISQFGKEVSLSKASQKLADLAFNFLVDAEKAVHGIETDIKDLHFHELASTDTIFDIVGFFYLWETLGYHQQDIIILPIAVGGGTVQIAHGESSVPAPATLEIIRNGNLVVQGGPIEKELLTPTGAAILAAVQAESHTFFPHIIINKIGRSYGTRPYTSDTIPFLQILEASKQESLQEEEITVLETNVDDVDGETLGYLFDALIKDSLVLDLSIIPTITKKNRPGHLIRVIVEPSQIIQVTKILSSELGTLGVRCLPGFRHIISRHQETHEIQILDNREIVRVKLGSIGSEQISRKVEFDDLKRIAKKANISLREARKRVLTALSSLDEEHSINRAGKANE